MQGGVIGLGKWSQLGFTLTGDKLTVAVCYPIRMMASTMSCVVLLSLIIITVCLSFKVTLSLMNVLKMKGPYVRARSVFFLQLCCFLGGKIAWDLRALSLCDSY